MLDMMGENPRLDTAAIQTVGTKGWDGFAVALVKYGATSTLRSASTLLYDRKVWRRLRCRPRLLPTPGSG